MQPTTKKVFFKALKEGNLGQIVELIKDGFDVNTVNDENKSPLELSVDYGFEPIVEALLNAGASFEHLDLKPPHDNPLQQPSSNNANSSQKITKEIKLICSDLLGYRETELNEKKSFFELGGDSLSATRFITRLHQKYLFQLSVVDLMDNTSIEEVIKSLEKHLSNNRKDHANCFEI